LNPADRQGKQAEDPSIRLRPWLLHHPPLPGSPG
jgi:hypothetical protein